MATTNTIVGFDSSTLLSYYSAKLGEQSAKISSTSSSSTSATAAAAKKNSATANDVLPWDSKLTSSVSNDADILNLTKFIDTSNVPVSAVGTDGKLEQDNQKLFSLYKAVNNLSYLSAMASNEDISDAQRVGYNKRFQSGLTEVQDFIKNQTFNNFTLQAKASASTVTSTAGVASATFNYTGVDVANEKNVNDALTGISSSDKFKISISKSGTTQDIEIDLSKVSGDLTMSNVVSYVNDQLKAAGVATRFKKTLTSGTSDTTDKNLGKYAIQVVPGGVEQVSLSSASSTPALYVAGTSGLTKATDKSAVNNQAKLIKLTDLSSDPEGVYNRTSSPTSGTTTATATVVDDSGNVYVLGNATGDFASQLNQGTQDVFLTKYDSVGNVTWTKLVGSAGSAEGAALALNPKGGVTVVGSTTADLSSGSVANGNKDSFAVQFDANGNKLWTTQIPTLNTNSASSVSVDSSGNVYIGGQTKGVLGKGETALGGKDGYVVKLDSTGKIASEQLIGTSSDDSVAATALTDSGDLLVASMQNGHAILSKYTGGDVSQSAVWTMDMGDLSAGGAISGLAVSNGKIYVSGTTTNGSLNATASTQASGGTDAFVFAATDNGTSVTSDHVSYLGTSTADKGGALTIGNDGTVYLAGTTSGTFSGQARTVADTTNMFVASVKTDGSVGWVKQYAGVGGQSSGQAVAFDDSGSSVLDALGLPSGKVSGKSNSSLTAATTLRAGDSFKIQIQGDAERTFTIKIDKGETLNSLVTKINGQFGNKGKASIVYGSNGASLKLEVNAGVSAKLIAGPTDTDALGRLGIDAQTLSKASTSSSSSSTTSSSSTSSTSSSSSSKKATYALGFSNVTLNLSTLGGAKATKASLSSVLNAIKNAYTSANTTTSSSSTSSSTDTGTLSAAAQAYNSNWNADASLALSILSA